MCTVVKSTTTWSASPGPNLPTFTWHTVQCMATAGKHRGFIRIVFWTEHVQIIVHLLLSTVTYRQVVLWQWTGTAAQGEEDQFAHRSLMKMFYSVLRRNPPQVPTQLVTESVWIVVLCVMFYASRNPILSIGRKDGVQVQALLSPQQLPSSRPICCALCTRVERSLTCHSGGVHGWGLLHPRGDFQ